MTRTRKIALFVLLAYALAALLAGGLYASGEPLQSQAGFLVALAYMFTPLIAAAITQKMAGEPIWAPLGARLQFNRWLLVGPGLALLVALLAAGISLLLPGGRFSPGLEGMALVLPPDALAQAQQAAAEMPVHPFFLMIPQALIAGCTVNALAAFGEEIGWRGFLQRELADLGFWACSIVTGLIWGFWHAPLILQGHNYPDHPVAGIFVFAGICALLSPLHSLVRLRSHTVWAAALCHGTFNAAAWIPRLVADGGDLTVGTPGLAGVLALILVNVGIIKAIGQHPKFYRGRPAARPAY